MKQIKYFSFVVCLSIAGLTVGCPYQSPCSCREKLIDCQTNSLTDIPPLNGTQQDGANLMFDTNQIAHVPANSLPKNLALLSFLYNPIISIDDAAFDDSASTLTQLMFSDFKFTRIPNAFSHLNNLKYLTLFDSPISDWNYDAMKHVGPTVQILFLQRVGLNAWPNWIQFFSNLTELSMEHGLISSIPENALDALSNSITSLSLANNSLTSVPKTISNLKSLQHLSLNNNSIVNVTWLPHVSNLYILGLEFNHISDSNHLSNTLRTYADSLSELTLHGNRLTQVPDLSFLYHIDGLDFTYNQLSNSDSGSLPKTLLSVYLGHNSLPKIPIFLQELSHVGELLMTRNSVTEIKGTDLSPWIYMIDLSYNLVKALTDTSFPQNSNITSVDLQGNPLSTVSAHVFDNLPVLLVLNFRDTKLTRLPLGLSSLTKVTYFYISNSDGLICTCAEKSLATWILNRPNEMENKCGQATIYDFFAFYSQSCP